LPDERAAQILGLRRCSAPTVRESLAARYFLG